MKRVDYYFEDSPYILWATSWVLVGLYILGIVGESWIVGDPGSYTMAVPVVFLCSGVTVEPY